MGIYGKPRELVESYNTYPQEWYIRPQIFGGGKGGGDRGEKNSPRE